ncbi:xylulokinase [Blastopirellula retiformator]|uniref:Xylulose kinase n=1 Tax=Blastopirellula retiformator TaxID=2527970 RepID=A0A5C5V8B9_9BACT|nr:xylulokinase [Blastopirellula retiformator]TWT34808.1 Xylulose kinase [Blastopirellula retiformator]
MSIYLGIDIGTSGTKTIAIREGGEILAESTATYPLHHPKPMWSEQDPDDWWNAVVKTVRRVVKEAKARPGEVKAIGLSGQMHGSVFLDKSDQVIRPALLWNDQRTVAECAEIEERAGGRAKLIKMVANPALTGFTAPKILWLRNNEPRNYARLAKVLLPKDEIRRRLTGEYATEVSDASGMLLLDVAKRSWSKRLLSKLELDESILGTVYESEEVTGTLTAEAAKRLGLTTDCVVVGGAGDCAANAVGNGVVKQGTLASSLGTSGVMFVHSDEVAIDPAGRLHTFCHAVRGKWHMMGVTLCAAGTLEWFVQRLCADLRSGRGKQDPYSVLNAEAVDIAPGSQGLFTLPYLAGERTPHADPNARGCFIGLTLSHTRGHVTRSIMEGVAYSLRDSLEIISDLGVPVRQIRAGGGGAKSPLWRQIQADVFGKKVVTINAEQGPAYGVALLAATGAGAYKNIQEACAATIQVVNETSVDRKAAKIYNEAFPVYQGLYKSLKEDFQRISALGQ